MVYLIADGEALKIGYTQYSAEKRLKSLQTGNPRELGLVGVFDNGGPALEQRLHAILSPYHLRGEWFEFVGPVLDLADGATADKASYDAWEHQAKLDARDKAASVGKLSIYLERITAQKASEVRRLERELRAASTALRAWEEKLIRRQKAVAAEDDTEVKAALERARNKAHEKTVSFRLEISELEDQLKTFMSALAF